MKYKIVLTRTDEGVGMRCPGLPGRWPQGATETEAIKNIRDAIAEYAPAAARPARLPVIARSGHWIRVDRAVPPSRHRL